MDDDQFNAELFRWDGAAAGIGLIRFLRYPQPIRNANPRLAPHRPTTPSNSNVSTSVNTPNSTVGNSYGDRNVRSPCPQNFPTGARGFFRRSKGWRHSPAPNGRQAERGYGGYAGLIHRSVGQPARRSRRKRLSGHCLEQPRPDRRGQAPRPLGRRPQGQPSPDGYTSPQTRSFCEGGLLRSTGKAYPGCS